MLKLIRAGCIASFCFILFGCANAAYHVKQLKSSITPYTIPDVPFYPQQEFFCGPTTLAEVANYHGLSLIPEQIAPQIFIPNREGSLQLEMIAATRQLGLLAYAEHGDLNLLVDLVKQDIPVIVLQNNGVSWLPQWHYSVVIGFDLPNENIILHTGLSENLAVNVGVFMNTWQRSNYWYLAAMPANKKVTQLEPFTYVKSAQDLLTTNQIEAGIAALKNAANSWQNYWLSYFLLGNYYFSLDSQEALSWYQQGIELSQVADKEANYLNNYAYALAENGCHELAIETISKAIKLEPDNKNLQQSKQELSQYFAFRQCKID